MSTFAVNDEAEMKQPSKLASLAARLVAKNEQDNLNEVEQVGKTNYRDDNRDSGDDESDDDGFGAHDSIDNEEDEEEEGEGDLGDAQMNMIERLVAARGSADAGTAAKITELLMSMGINWGGAERVKRTDVFGEDNIPSIENLAERLKSGKYKRIVVLTGAGVSVAAGIPDFRTPGTGLYDNLEKYNLPHPTAVFDIDFYKKNPSPFVMLASEIWPGRHLPTLTHAFLKVLDDKGLLLRNYTQNIDGLEVIAGVKEESVIECHGHFRTARCTSCKSPMSIDFVSKSIIEDGVPPICSKCGGIGKPDIVFFGEDLPNVFHNNINRDCRQADLLIVIGTSLAVQPVASIPEFVSDSVPRVLLNREHVGGWDRSDYNYRDVFVSGNCDDSVEKLCGMLEWSDELKAAYESVKGRGGEGKPAASAEEVD